jgi:hypothetical protein
LRPEPHVSISYWINESTSENEEELRQFLNDNPAGDASVWWDIPIHFRDTDETLVETIVRLTFEVKEESMSFCAVPYTQKSDI